MGDWVFAAPTWQRPSSCSCRQRSLVSSVPWQPRDAGAEFLVSWVLLRCCFVCLLFSFPSGEEGVIHVNYDFC